MLGQEQIRRYAWADRDADLGWTLAVVTGRDPDDVIRAYGGDVDPPPPRVLFSEALVDPDEVGDVSMVQLRHEGPHVLMIENIGWLGQDRGTAEKASAGGGHFISVSWGMNANTWITQARNGVIVANFEPLTLVTDGAHPPVPKTELASEFHIYPDWTDHVEFSVASLGATMLAVIEQQTGLAFDRAWLDEPMPTYRIPYPGTQPPGKPSPVLA